MPKTERYRTARLKIFLYGRQNISVHDFHQKCQELTAVKTLNRVIFSVTKKENPTRHHPYSHINLFVQAPEKELSEPKLKKLFRIGSDLYNLEVIPHKSETKDESIKICKGFCKAKLGSWIKDDQVVSVQEFVSVHNTTKITGAKTHATDKNTAMKTREDDCLHKELECPVCYELMEDAVATSFGNLYCRRCITAHIDRQKAHGWEIRGIQTVIYSYFMLKQTLNKMCCRSLFK